jgi:hypothetical protein
LKGNLSFDKRFSDKSEILSFDITYDGRLVFNLLIVD